LARLSEFGTVTQRSALYRTVPWGRRDQADFVNAAAILETGLPPALLLAALQGMEQEFGRVRGLRWGPRVLDLDLLTYDDLRLDGPQLTLPHPHLFERAFVLVPLAEIDPAFAAAAGALSPAERAEVVPLEEVKRSGPCPPAVVPGVHWDEVTRRIREVAAACVAGGLARVRVVQADFEVEVRRSGSIPAAVPEGVLEPAAQAPPSGNGLVARAEPAVVRSDVVGIVRFSHPTVSEGAILAEERELASVESLGIRNPVSSGGPGRVVAVFVSDGQPVEYAQPLFAIDRP
jgi:2-amino-4-hydroxy-6-hydroxymethyldihydropteridine diphosphokinase